MTSLVFRNLQLHEIVRIAEIDRGEEITGHYVFENKTLKLISSYEMVSGFDPMELQNLLDQQRQLLEDGGKVIGVFSHNALVGVASVERRRRGTGFNYCKMDILYVSKNYRGKKIGQGLIEESKKAARLFGADKLYISATPTKHTVDFYIKHGAMLVQELDESLYRKEPDDIHLEIIA
jgi:GNAT superfamily N-acetyltransferase